jgi:photosystem II stability/assembly factor-like uncharacterized protein
MKSLKLLFILLVLTGSISAQWVQVGAGTTTSQLWSVSFADASKVFAVGVNGTMVKSVDGGQNWSLVAHGLTTKHLYTIKFSSNLVGYAGGVGLTLLKTTDGGTTWTDIRSNLPTALLEYTASSLDFYDINFTDDNNGYAVGFNGVVIKTTDGGATWTNYSTIGSGTYRSSDFIDSNVGFLASHGNNLKITENGGATFTVISHGYTVTHFFDVQVVTPTVIIATGQPGIILRSADAGATWSKIATPNNTNVQLLNMVFVSSTAGYIIGQSGMLYKTTDAGATWEQMTAGTANALRGIDFKNGKGVAAGDGGVIIYYSSITTASPELSDNRLQIYPNPVKDILNINAEVKKLTVRDITGKVVLLSETQQNINMAHLSKGVYLLQVQTAEGLIEKKIMKD